VKLTSAPTQEDGHYWLKDGDLLITRSNTPELVGHVAMYDGTPARAICCDLIMKMQVDPRKAHTRYLYYYLRSPEARDYLTSRAQGASSTMKKIGKQVVQEIPVPVPSLSEQQRITSILDEAFDGIAIARANGKKNLQQCRELVESGYSSIVGIHDKVDWSRVTVADIAANKKGSVRTGPFGSQLLHSEFVDDGIAVLGIDNAVANEFRWDRRRFITPEKFTQLARYKVHPGDVLITIMGTCGRCAVVPDDIPVAINTKHLCCITLDQRRCLPRYLHIYFLHDPDAKEYLLSQASGSVMDGLNMGIISDMPVKLPPIEVQTSIINQFDVLMDEAKGLMSIGQRKMVSLDELKQSLLNRAFNGEL